MRTKDTQPAEPPQKKQKTSKRVDVETNEEEPPQLCDIDEYGSIPLIDRQCTVYAYVKETGYVQIVRTMIHSTDTVRSWSRDKAGWVCFNKKEKTVVVTNKKRNRALLEYVYKGEDAFIEEHLIKAVTMYMHKAIVLSKNEKDKKEKERLEGHRAWCAEWLDHELECRAEWINRELKRQHRTWNIKHG